MRVAIIGCGSMGLLWAARILRTEHELVLFARTEDQKVKINENGLTLVSYQNQKEHYQVRCEKASYSHKGPFDMVLVTVKQTHLTNLIPAIQSLTQPESQIVFHQNGLGHEERIYCLYNRPWTYALITTEGALRISPFEVHHTGVGNSWLGRFPGSCSLFHPNMERFMQSFNGFHDFEIHRDDMIIRRMWEKFLTNCVINPLTAIHNVKNGELQSFSREMDRIITEVVQVSLEMGFNLSEEELAKKILDVCSKTSMNFSSMVQDIQRGVPTEINYLNGVLIRWGKQVGIDTSYNQELFDQVKKLEVENANS